MKIRRLLAVGLLTGATAAGAADKDRDAVLAACRGGADLLPEIKSCTDNPQATQAANACRDALRTAWKNANGELMLVMSVAHQNLDAKQQADFFHSHSDMQLAIDKLQALVDLTQQSADLLAQYPRVMFDNPYADPGLVGSSNCYKKNFLAISDVVGDLDDKAEQGLDALAAVDQLRGVSQARDDGMGSGTARSVTGGLRGDGAGNRANGTSDVTGLAQDEAKQRSAGGTSATGSSPALSSVKDSGGKISVVGASTVTNGTASPASGSQALQTGSSAGGGRSASAAISPGGAAGRSLGSGEGTTVAAAIFTEGRSGGIHLAVDPSSVFTGESPAVSPAGGLDEAEAPGGMRALASSDVAAADIDLFGLVSGWYRASDFFQHPR